MSEESKTWEIYISKDEFENIRKDPRFVSLLLLGRIVNGINFCLQSLLESNRDPTPTGQRQRFNSFLLACGVLYEGLKVANTLGKHFSDRKSFRNGFGRLLSDEETKKLQGTVLNSMRNKVAFHYDEDVVATTLENLDLATYAFATASSETLGAIYFRLADEVAINFIIGEPGSREEENQIFREILASTSHVLTEFVRCANELIPDVLKEMNWLRRKLPNGP